MNIDLQSPVTALSGCGKKRAELLKVLGIESIGQLLRHFPRGYQNRGDVKPIDKSSVGVQGAFVLTVSSSPVSVRIPGGRTLTKCKAFDGEKSATLVFFNRPYVKDVLNVGCTYRFWGKLNEGKTGFELSPSIIEPVTDGRQLKKLIPVYPLTEGLTQSFVSGLILNALAVLSPDSYDEILPEGIRESLGVCGLLEAYRGVHDPKNAEMIETGRTRFIAEELFVFACSVAGAKSGRKSISGKRMDPDKSKLYDFTAALPYTLTRAQSKVISEIRKDMTGMYPMARLVSGDVGSGKTVCAAAAAYIAVKNGTQCALMAPTEILASQHYRDLSELFERLGIKCGYLSGSLTAAQKRKIYERLESGEIDFIIGTHALLSDGVVFKDLGLVITDEQHRFGVLQRAGLTEKGKSPHVLVMSATPIPRTLALILCGDLDISVIDEHPPGRQPVDTLIVGERHRDRMNGFIEEQVKLGKQVYIVCPTVESSEETEEEEKNDTEFIRFDFEKSPEKLPKLKSAVEYEENLRTKVFPSLRTAFIHGRMSGTEKYGIMSRFENGEIDILVSTTVIEVGVNVPNATVMVVENAERFGLSQLHQLRGRVGRGRDKAYCILVSDATGEKARRRLEVMKTVRDGYKIAKYDLEMRGPGDFVSFGEKSARQHGAFGFKLAGLCTDTLLLEKCFCEAEKLISEDPNVLSEKNSLLAKEIKRVQGIGISVLN